MSELKGTRARGVLLRGAVLATLLFVPPVDGGAAARGSRSEKAAPVRAPQRDLKRRTLTITDASFESVSELRVAAGTPTTLVFPVAVRTDGVLLADFKGAFFPPQISDRNLIVVPKQDLAPGELVTLTVPLADGTMLPFKLMTVPREADLQVDVEVALEQRAAPESPAALKSNIQELRGQLDECRTTEAQAGIAKIAALVLAQDPSTPQAFTAERHPVRHLDKQSRLLVEARTIYRLFGQAYLVLTVENRDPAKAWVLERAELRAEEGQGGPRLPVLSARTERPALASGETQRLVVTFEPGERKPDATFELRLFEKAGGRHVQLSGLRL